MSMVSGWAGLGSRRWGSWGRAPPRAPRGGGARAGGGFVWGWGGGGVGAAAVGIVGQGPGQGLVEHHAQGVEVGALVAGLGADLLGCGVGGGVGAALEAVAEGAASGDAQVEQRRRAGRADEDVSGLEVPVDEPGVVDAGQDLQQLEGGGAQRCPGQGGALSGEGLPLQALHDDEVGAAVVPIVEHADHAGQACPAQGSDLAADAPLIALREGRQELDGDGAAVVLGQRPPDLPEAADAQQPLQPVAPHKQIAGLEGLGGAHTVRVVSQLSQAGQKQPAVRGHCGGGVEGREGPRAVCGSPGLQIAGARRLRGGGGRSRRHNSVRAEG